MPLSRRRFLTRASRLRQFALARRVWPRPRRTMASWRSSSTMGAGARFRRRSFGRCCFRPRARSGPIVRAKASNPFVSITATISRSPNSCTTGAGGCASACIPATRIGRRCLFNSATSFATRWPSMGPPSRSAAGASAATRQSLVSRKASAGTGSLFVLRRLAVSWQQEKQSVAWRNFAPAMAKYAADRLALPAHQLPADTMFSAWFRANESALRADARLREKNVIIARQLLPLFEAEPSTAGTPFGYLNLGAHQQGKPLTPAPRRMAKTTVRQACTRLWRRSRLSSQQRLHPLPPHPCRPV